MYPGEGCVDELPSPKSHAYDTGDDDAFTEKLATEPRQILAGPVILQG